MEKIKVLFVDARENAEQIYDDYARQGAGIAPHVCHPRDFEGSFDVHSQNGKPVDVVVFMLREKDETRGTEETEFYHRSIEHMQLRYNEVYGVNGASLGVVIVSDRCEGSTRTKFRDICERLPRVKAVGVDDHIGFSDLGDVIGSLAAGHVDPEWTMNARKACYVCMPPPKGMYCVCKL